MHTITGLRKALALTTTNQVRNRIEAIRDVLEPHLRRGPNNQILLTDDGLALLRRLQELYDSGLRMNEASDVLRASSVSTVASAAHVSRTFVSREATPDASDLAVERALRDEVAFLRSRLADLESRLVSPEARRDTEPSPWWAALREDVDVA